MGRKWLRFIGLILAGVACVAVLLPLQAGLTEDRTSPAGLLAPRLQAGSPDTGERSVLLTAPEAAEPGLTEPASRAPAALECRALAQTSGRIAPWHPAGPQRVGLQAGHWLTQEAPDVLSRLRTQTGTSGGGYTEWQVNLDIAQKTAALLTDLGVEAQVLPTTVPPCYRAHAFLAIHADGDVSGALRGFKVARASVSAIPDSDDALVGALNGQYAEVTRLPRDDDHISRRMLYYYAFNYRRQAYSIAPDVPAAIIETGFLTNPVDRGILTARTDRVAAGIANGILQFLGRSDRIPQNS